jgi:hypothetical protein
LRKKVNEWREREREREGEREREVMGGREREKRTFCDSVDFSFERYASEDFFGDPSVSTTEGECLY